MKIERAELEGTTVPVLEPTLSNAATLPASKAAGKPLMSKAKAKSIQELSDRLGSVRRIRGGHLPRDAQSLGDREGCRDPMPPVPDAQHRECSAASDQPPRGSASPPGTIDSEWACQAIHAAGDVSYECKLEYSPETNQERSKFLRLVNQYLQELRDVQGQMESASTVYDVFEVFCHPQSNLTHQCQQQGFKAMRFSLEQCDLQSFEGRRHLFQILD